MSKFSNKQFWLDTLDRVAASFVQGFIATTALGTVGLLDIDWIEGLSLAGSYALLSFGTAIGLRGEKDHKIVKTEK